MKGINLPRSHFFDFKSSSLSHVPRFPSRSFTFTFHASWRPISINSSLSTSFWRDHRSTSIFSQNRMKQSLSRTFSQSIDLTALGGSYSNPIPDSQKILQNLVEETSASQIQPMRRGKFKSNKAIPRIGGLYEDFFIEKFKSFINQRKWLALREAFDRSKDEGIVTTDMCDCLIMGTMKARNLQEMAYYWNQMRRLGVAPTQELFHAMIYSYGQFGDLKKAVMFKNQMEAFGFPANGNTYSSLLQAAAIARDYDSMFQFQIEMKERRISVDDSIMYPVVVKLSQNETNDFPERFLHQMKKSNNPLFAFNLVLGFLIYQNQLAKAEELIHSYKHADNLTYCFLILGHCNEGNYEKAHNYFEKAISLAAPFNSLGLFSLQALLGQVTIPHRYPQAKLVWKEVMDKKVPISAETIELFANAAVDQKDLETVRELFQLHSSSLSDALVSKASTLVNP